MRGRVAVLVMSLAFASSASAGLAFVASAHAAGAAHAGTARALGPALGAWRGTSAAGAVQFVVTRVQNADVLSDVVVNCAGSAGNLDGAWQGSDSVGRAVAAISANGTITAHYRIPSHPRITYVDGPLYYARLRGRLQGGHGVISIDPAGRLTPGGTGACALRRLAVSPDGAQLRRDGVYTLTGPTGTSGQVSVFGAGAMLNFANDSFGTPDGVVDPETDVPCASVQAAAIVGPYSGIDVYPSGPSRTFSTSSVDPLYLSAVTFSGQFLGAASVVGDYTASYDTLASDCLGEGQYTLTLASPAPKLIAVLPLHGRSAPAPARHPRPRRHRHRLRTIRYVALGDSYSSGEGVAPYQAGTDTRTDRCHRSTRAYPELLTLPGVRLERFFYACSGATTENLLDASRSGEPPQLTHPSLRNAGLVTLTIGGNDAGFGYSLARCMRIVPVRCYRGNIARTIEANIDGLATSLVDSYVAIRERAPRGAHVVVLDYPDVFPAPGQPRCGKLRALYSARSTAFLHRAGDRLDDVIEAAARTAGVRFVDVRGAFAGHQVCSAHEWIDFIVRGRHIVPSMGSFHPNAAGQTAYARVLHRALTH